MGKDNTEHRAENKKYNRTLLYIGAAVFLATILFVVFFPSGKSKVYIADTPVSSPTSAQNTAASAPPAVAVPANTKAPESLEIKKADTPVAVPFIYEKNNDIYMASGKNHTKLGSRQSLYGCYKEMNCALSEDNRFLYYIEKTDINTGMGTLKKISTDTVYSPVTIEEGVCAAEVSADGSIMYIKNAEGITGELYLYKDEKSSFISKNVLPVFLRFSKGGSCISYVVKEGSGAFALYVKKNGEKPALVTRFTAEATLNDGLNLSRFNGAVPFDTGAVLYSIEENYNMPLYFYDSSGKTETICGDGYIIKTYPGGDFLYADIAKNNLWYKQPGSKAVNITVNYSYSRFPKNTDRFLLIEHTGDGFENSRVMMYEVDEKKEKTAISLGDDAIFEINAAFDCVAYESGGVLYASRKTDSGWREVLLLEASAGISPGSKSGIVARFDEAGENLYFFDEYKCSPLYRYSLKDGKTVKLIDNVDKLDVYENAVYAHIPSDKLYRIEGGTKKMISEGVREVRETEGGAYLLFNNGSFKFVPKGSQNARLMDSFTRAAGVTASIEYRAPLAEDLGAALEVLSDEANYCLYKLGVYRTKAIESISVTDALAIAQELAGRKDISATERGILNYMVEGFKAYQEKKRSDASASLKKAVSAYEKYINSPDSDEER